MFLQPGTIFAGYRVDRQIGSGAMGIVYLAYDTHLSRPVAIKILPLLLADVESNERFRRESQALARLRHPHILEVFSGGVEHGTPFLVTEYAPGGTLAERISQQPLSTDAAVALLKPIADAIDYIHGQGIVHRDVKPQNILLAATGEPMLADFGIARLRGMNNTLTAAGELLGTPAYMAPEYVTGTPVSPATDRYALAVLTYELLVGQLPYTGSTGIQLLLAHAQGPLPKPRLVNPRITPALEAVLLRGLARYPVMRYPTAVAFIDALTAAVTSPATMRVSPPPAPPSNNVVPARISAPPPSLIQSSPADVVLPPLPKNFWWLWSAGTIVVPIGGILATTASTTSATSSPNLTWAILGCMVGVANVLLALSTHGYSKGRCAKLGRDLVRITGIIGAILAVAATIIIGIALLALAGSGKSRARGRRYRTRRRPRRRY